MKYLFLFIYISFSFANNYELKLYEKVFTTLFNKDIVKLYVNDNDNKKMFLNSKVLQLTSCEDSDIVISSNFRTLKCMNKPVFSTSYIDFLNSNSIGAFYWRKGRPQLILNRYMVQFYHLNIDKSLLKYVK